MSLSEWTHHGFIPWAPLEPTSEPSRALVLGGGGATGIGWMGGLFAELRDLGVDVRDADTMIGTSAGSVVAAHLRVGTPDEVAMARMEAGVPLEGLGRLGAADAARFVRASLLANRSEGRSLIGRASVLARTTSEDAWLEMVAADLKGVDWPRRHLLITAVDCDSGTSVVFDNDCGIPLDRAVAASCTVPGVFPPVTIDGRRYMDGGVRSVANVDLATGHDRVLVVAPIPIGFRRHDRPAHQARRLRDRSRTLVIVPDGPSRRALGPNPLDMRRAPAAVRAGREQAHRVLERVRRLWLGD